MFLPFLVDIFIDDFLKELFASGMWFKVANAYVHPALGGKGLATRD